jgi:hypothetical protein
VHTLKTEEWWGYGFHATLTLIFNLWVREMHEHTIALSIGISFNTLIKTNGIIKVPKIDLITYLYFRWNLRKNILWYFPRFSLS